MEFGYRYEGRFKREVGWGKGVGERWKRRSVDWGRDKDTPHGYVREPVGREWELDRLVSGGTGTGATWDMLVSGVEEGLLVLIGTTTAGVKKSRMGRKEEKSRKERNRNGREGKRERETSTKNQPPQKSIVTKS